MPQSMIFTIAGISLIVLSAVIWIVDTFFKNKLPSWVVGGKLLVLILGIACLVIAVDIFVINQNHIK